MDYNNNDRWIKVTKVITYSDNSEVKKIPILIRVVDIVRIENSEIRVHHKNDYCLRIKVLETDDELLEMLNKRDDNVLYSILPQRNLREEYAEISKLCKEFNIKLC